MLADNQLPLEPPDESLDSLAARALEKKYGFGDASL